MSKQKADAILLTDISVRYASTSALENVTVTVPKSSITGLVGMNGAGKSTLFKVIMGQIQPETGSVQLAGHTVKQAQKQGLVAYVPQGEAIDWNFPVSVWNVAMMGRYQFMGITRTPGEADIDAAKQALERVHLLDFADRQIGQLSGGQRKRAFVARALAQGAAILLLDEPFAGVDAKTEAALVELLQELQSHGITILITAHDLSTIGTYCEHMILLNKKVIAAGPTKKVFTAKNIAKTYESDFLLKKGAPWMS